MAYQLKDFICSPPPPPPHLPVQCYLLFHSNPSLAYSLVEVKTDGHEAEVTGKQSLQDVFFKLVKRHSELPATSPIIPRKNQQREVLVKISTPRRTSFFVVTARRWIEYRYQGCFVLFTAAFHCGGHTLVQKSDIDGARCLLNSF